MVGGEFEVVLSQGAAGEMGLKSPVGDNETFPLEHLPHCLGSSECQEGL